MAHAAGWRGTATDGGKAGEVGAAHLAAAAEILLLRRDARFDRRRSRRRDAPGAKAATGLFADGFRLKKRTIAELRSVGRA